MPMPEGNPAGVLKAPPHHPTEGSSKTLFAQGPPQTSALLELHGVEQLDSPRALYPSVFPAKHCPYHWSPT
jgi:hypothetical protein